MEAGREPPKVKDDTYAPLTLGNIPTYVCCKSIQQFMVAYCISFFPLHSAQQK